MLDTLRDMGLVFMLITLPRIQIAKLHALMPSFTFQPISASAFSAGGDLFAYAVNYDWSGGVEGLLKLPQEGRGSHVMLHQVKQECAPKNSTTK